MTLSFRPPSLPEANWKPTASRPNGVDVQSEVKMTKPLRPRSSVGSFLKSSNRFYRRLQELFSDFRKNLCRQQDGVAARKGDFALLRVQDALVL